MRAVRFRAPILVAVMVGSLSGVTPIAALAAAGDLDPTFDSDGLVTTDVAGATDLGQGVAVQADGKVVASGQCQVAGSFDFCLARYNVDGTLDATFGSGGKVTTSFTAGTDRARDVTIQPDGRIVAAGSCQTGQVGNTWDTCVARYTSGGALDGTFGAGGKVVTDAGCGSTGCSADEFAGLVATHAGKILVGGTCGSTGDADPCFIRYNADGSLDTTFDEFNHDGMTKWDWGGLCSMTAMAVAPDGRFYGASQCGGDFHVARYASIGTPEESDFPFMTTGGDGPFAAALQADGKLVVGGTCGGAGVPTNSDICLIRYGLEAELTLDPTFGGDGRVFTEVTDFQNIAVGVHVLADGNILAGGRCEVAQNVWDFCAFRYLADGTLDASFGGDGIVTTDFGSSDQGIDSAVYPDGRLVMVGQCGSPPVDFCLARYQGDDSTPPVVTITIDSTDSEAASGWYNAASSGTDGVLVHVSATDPSGVTSLTCSEGSTPLLNVVSTGSFTLTDGQHSFICIASDGTNLGAGPGSTPQPVQVDVDQTAPSIACFEHTFVLNAAPGTIQIADLDDATSGTPLTGWLETDPDTSTPGSHPVLVSIDDNAGNVAEETCGYQVEYGFAGFHAPVSTDTFDYANAITGKLIPFRFTLTDAFGHPVQGIPKGVAVALAGGSCTGTSTSLASSDYAKGKAGLIEVGNGEYVFRWKAARSDRGECRLIGITLADGVEHEATISFAP